MKQLEKCSGREFDSPHLHQKCYLAKQSSLAEGQLGKSGTKTDNIFDGGD
jgi:hypothetical protein